MPVIETSAGPIEYEDTGGAGAVVVLLHGLAMDAGLWSQVVPALGAGHRVIIPTLPLGAHRMPMRADADLSLLGLSRLVDELLERLELTDVTLCFNDWSAAQVMVAHRLVERVGRLVLISCEAFDNYPPGLPGRLASLSVRFPGGIGMMRRSLLTPALRGLPIVFGLMSKRGVPDEQMARWLESLARPDIRRDFKKYAGDVRAGRREMLAASDALRSFERPVLIVWGSEDRLMPLEHGRRLAALCPHSELIEVPDTYTLVPIDQPAVLAGHLRDFLSRTAVPAQASA